LGGKAVLDLIFEYESHFLKQHTQIQVLKLNRTEI
jgi:hypothetical protein